MANEFRCPSCGEVIPDGVELEHGQCAACGTAFLQAFTAAEALADSRMSDRERAVLAGLDERMWLEPISHDEASVEARYSSLFRQAFNQYSSESRVTVEQTDGPLSEVTMYTRWEYCRLEVENPPYAPPSGVQLAVTLTWLGATGYQVPIATVGDESSWSLDINPWDFAIGALGKAGWEMVSIQHADQTASTSEFSYATAIAWDRAIAVFKRPKLSGRPIDDLSLLT